jgi:hypothetical protein
VIARLLESIEESQAESDALYALLDVIRHDERFARLRVGYLADTIEEMAAEYADDADDGRLNAVLGGYTPR